MSSQSTIIELINVAQDLSWISWGVQYFFLIGLSFGALLLTLPRYLFKKPEYEKAAKLALMVALTCGIAAPIALLSDLHQPGRFYSFYLHFTPTSLMSWGSFLLPLYLFSLMFYAWLIYRPALAQQASQSSGLLAGLSRLLAMGGGHSQRAIKLAGVVTLLFALGVLLYTGSEMAIIKARPLWHGPMMPLLFLFTGMSGAAALGLLLNRLLATNDASANRQLGRSMARYLAISLLLFLVWFGTGTLGLSESGYVLKRLVLEYNPLSIGLGWLLLCTVLPLLLIWSRPQTSYWFAGGLALVGAWLFRWSMFIDGQRIPKTGAGFYDYPIPAGSEGWLGMLGTLGLWVVLVVLLTSILPWHSNESNKDDSKEPETTPIDL